MKITKEQFMEKCLEFEQIVRTLYPVYETESPYMYISRLEEFENYVDDINVIRILRNTFAHNITIINGVEAIDIKPIVYESLLHILQILKHPDPVETIASQHIICANEQQTIHDVMKQMKQYNLSQIPILKNNIVQGVFSENTVFQLLIHHKNNIQEKKIKDVLNYCNIQSHSNEYYEFISKNIPVSMAKKRFKRVGKKRLSMLLMTEHGKENEPLLGIITAWDFIK